MKVMNRERAKEYAAKVYAQPKECYRNSILTAYMISNAGEEVEYVEGLLMLCEFGIFIHHGWVETKTEILDVTLDDCDARCYDAVFRYDVEAFKRNVHQSKMLPFFPYEQDGYRIMGTRELELWREVELRYAKVAEEAQSRVEAVFTEGDTRL